MSNPKINSLRKQHNGTYVLNIDSGNKFVGVHRLHFMDKDSIKDFIVQLREELTKDTGE